MWIIESNVEFFSKKTGKPVSSKSYFVDLLGGILKQFGPPGAAAQYYTEGQARREMKRMGMNAARYKPVKLKKALEND
jgi:hypothetical protein